jgi:hypothetical protein
VKEWSISMAMVRHSPGWISISELCPVSVRDTKNAAVAAA